MKSSLATLALFVAAGCTAHNPNFVVDAGEVNDLTGNTTTDFAGGIVDLAGPMGACTAGQRQCTGTQASDRCEGGMFVVDRSCPAGSECMSSSYCAPPPPGIGTEVGQRCDANGGAQQLQCSASLTQNLSCQPFVDPTTKELRWYCDAPVAAGAAGTACTRGNQCRSGFCGGNGTCFEACQAAGPGSGCMLRCQSVKLVVEGVTQTAKSCIP